jgi:hypothetical protein
MMRSEGAIVDKGEFNSGLNSVLSGSGDIGYSKTFYPNHAAMSPRK